jgi:hypothetical protein
MVISVSESESYSQQEITSIIGKVIFEKMIFVFAKKIPLLFLKVV